MTSNILYSDFMNFPVVFELMDMEFPSDLLYLFSFELKSDLRGQTGFDSS